MKERNTGLRNITKTTCIVAWIMVIMAAQAVAQSETWTTKAPMPVPLTAMAAGVVNGKLYIAGGFHRSSGHRADTFAYDPKTDTWATRAPMPTPRNSAASAVVDGILYVVGGNYQGRLATVEAYNPKTDTWAAKAPMPTARYHAAAGVVDGVIYVAGGIGFQGMTVSTLEAYDQKTDTWTTKASMPTARYGAAAGVIGGILYLAGGGRTAPNPGQIHPVEAYDAKTNTWSTKASIPTPRYWVGAAVLDGMLYVAGGAAGGVGFLPRTTNAVEAYDPETDSWIVKPSMPTERFSAATGVADDVLYVVGGLLDPNRNPDPSLAVNESFTPFLFVGIDIKPGDPKNTINLKSAGTLAVAILGSATFDPLTVDPDTVILAGARVATRGRGQPMTALRDVNHDGYPDLLLRFRTRNLQLTPASTQAVLYGETFSGQRICGTDSVRIVPAPLSAKPIPNRSFERRTRGRRALIPPRWRWL